MNAPTGQALRDLPPEPNPYTDDDPLVVRDHPWRDNRPLLVAAGIVMLAPLLWLAIRTASGASPVWTSRLTIAVAMGVPLGVAMAFFPILLSSGAKVILGGTYLTRVVKGRRGQTKSVRLVDLRGGILASRVRYRRDSGKELVLFLPDAEIVWIADGISSADIERVARALSTHGVREYAEPIDTTKLRALVQKARRGGAQGSG